MFLKLCVLVFCLNKIIYVSKIILLYILYNEME